MKTGEYKGKGIAWDITPYLSFLPKSVGDTSFISNLGAGIGVATGELTSYVSQFIEAEISNEFDGETPSNYSFLYQGGLNSAPLRHTRYSWLP